MSILYRLMYRLGVTPWDRVLPAELTDGNEPGLGGVVLPGQDCPNY